MRCQSLHALGRPRARWWQDTDGDGVVSRADFEAAMQTLEPHTMEADPRSLRTMFDSVDTDGDGQIDYEEFSAWWTGNAFEEKILSMGKKSEA